MTNTDNQLRYERLTKGLDHARDLFVYHATQRHNSIRFFFIAVAIFLTGFFAVITADSGSFVAEGRTALATVESIAALVITLCFWRIDERNVALVHSDERLLKSCERELASLTGIQEYNTVEFSDTLTPRFLQYTWIMRFMFLAVACLCVLGILLAAGCFGTRA